MIEYLADFVLDLFCFLCEMIRKFGTIFELQGSRKRC